MFLSLSLLLASLTFMLVGAASAQAPDPNLVAPYGGVLVTPAELAPNAQGPHADQAGSGICPESVTPGCVLAGQYNRYRQSTNYAEPTLANQANVTQYFTNVNYFQTLPTDYYPGGPTKSNPILAQPLWVAKVPMAGGGTPNVLIAVTLNGTIYAFDADSKAPGGTILWMYATPPVGAPPPAGPPLYQNCVSGAPVVDPAGGPAGVLPYYGIISTPVVDVTWTDPVLFTASACAGVSGVQWYLNAIDVTNRSNLLSGPVGGAGGAQILDPNNIFSAGNQLQRPSLLITHATVNNQLATYLYISFGTSVNEIDPSEVYHGWVFGYTITYGTGTLPVSATLLANSPFGDTLSSTVTGAFPPVSAAAPNVSPANMGPYLNPSCAKQGNNCFDGDNWVDVGGHGGGIWMSGKGPSSDRSGNVYAGSGNGPFDCLNPSDSACLTSAGSVVRNYGESVMEIPVGSVTPADFFTPNLLHYANDGTPGSQFQALNRYDLDFGTPGVVLFDTTLNGAFQTWAATADKTGYVYVMPTPGSGPGVSLGQYQPQDAGLTSGTYSTQPAFAASRVVGGSLVCPFPPKQGVVYSSANCDQIMELVFWNNLLFAWPWHETAMTFQGSANYNSVTGSYTYQFGPRNGACGVGQNDANACTNFPSALYPGANMAIAANGNANATLWASLVYNNNQTPSSGLWGYNVGTSTPFLSNIFNPSISAQNATNCAGLIPTTLPTSWNPSEFVDPTLANGRIYLALTSASNGSGLLPGGVIQVFGACK